MKNVFHSFDLDSDGTLKRIEVLRYMKTMDTNKDKILQREELFGWAETVSDQICQTYDHRKEEVKCINYEAVIRKVETRHKKKVRAPNFTHVKINEVCKKDALKIVDVYKSGRISLRQLQVRKLMQLKGIMNLMHEKANYFVRSDKDDFFDWAVKGRIKDNKLRRLFKKN